MKIKQQLVSSRSHTYGGKNPCNFITIHETANYGRGAGAQSHANLQSRGFSASWHYQVDDKEIIQSYQDEVQCWHAGDGIGKGNKESIGIEICVNIDSDFKEAVVNTAELVKHLMEKHNIPLKNVVQHHHWSGKDCPHQLRSGAKGITWESFIKMVGNVKNTEIQTSTSTNQDKPTSVLPPSNYTGYSIVDYLKSIGVDSNTANRKMLAKQYGVQNYNFSAEKNIELLNKMRNAKIETVNSKRNTVHLPASAKTWRTYKLNVQPIKKNSDWSLTPSKFGGLTYEILGRAYPNVVTIQTSKGKRNIYVGPETSAVITENSSPS